MIEQPSEVPASPRRADSTFIDKQRIRRWSLIAMGTFALLMIVCLFVVPQTYKGTVSMQVTNSGAAAMAGSSGIISALTGAASPNTKYIGVLGSRTFAEEIAKQIGLQRMYRQEFFDDTVETMAKATAVTDNPKDGLLYVDVSLKGPPRINLFSSPRRKDVVRYAAAQAADLYADLLKKYAKAEDTEGNDTLIGLGTDELSKDRANYDNSVRNLTAFVRAHASDMGDLPLSTSKDSSSSGIGGGSSPIAEELGTLYTTQASLQADILGSEAALHTGDTLRAEQLRNLKSLPSEDPMLTQARGNVLYLQTTLDNDRVLLGPDHPTVVADVERLRLAQLKLDEQTSGIKRGLTTPQTEAAMKLKELKTKLGVLNGQIAKLEKEVKVGRELAMEFERLKGEVMLNLEVLKTVWTGSVTLTLQAKASDNRITIVDRARVQRKGSPDTLMFILLCLAMTTLIVGVWIHFEHVRFNRSLAQRPTGPNEATS